MRAKADSKRKQRAAFIALAWFMLLASDGVTLAQGMDATDRQDKMDMNREKAESRIDRLHNDQQRYRAQEKTKLKKPRKAKKPQQRLQF